MNWDHRLSKRIYDATRRSGLLRPAAMFGATDLLFVLLTVVVLTFGRADAAGTLVGRAAPGIFFLGIPLFAVWMLASFAQGRIKRRRPYDAGQGDPLITMVWTGPSFPSAHASIAFATAAFGLVTDAAAYGVWLFLGAALVALSRVAVGVHYAGDVLAGAALGAAFGLVAGWAVLLVQ